ncbi:MAG: cobyrinate a,c-diamide synthase [Dehalococcoidia bacterium]|nr:cobyrinate a,c-diamide synthase [Dehalococcoidia bacterium]
MIGIARLVLGGTWSGVGKTTLATGIMAALRGRGLAVQPFKVGPDYIDPSYHTLACGRTSRNIDTWMAPPEACLELFHRACLDAGIAIIEGVMGLFDGRSGLDDTGSTAHVARLLQAPVVLVMDVGHTCRSAAAVALGFNRLDPRVRIAGVILNRIGSQKHLRWTKEAVEGETGIPVVGHLPKDAGLHIPERHLGLVPTAERDRMEGFLAHLRQAIEEHIDLDLLLDIARSAGPLDTPPASVFPPEPVEARCNLAVARDEAFSFYYQDNLDLLEAYGARLVYFSPLHDAQVPPETQGIYLGGGFPEVYAETLSANQSMLRSIRDAAGRGIPVYAECGGLMYLTEGITDFEGRRFPMVGLAPRWSTMKKKRAALGYVEVEVQGRSILSARGATLRGHVFHWSEIEPFPPEGRRGLHVIVPRCWAIRYRWLAYQYRMLFISPAGCPKPVVEQ